MIKTYLNCKTAHTGLYKPHTIFINDHGVSISHSDSSESIKQATNFYTKKYHMKKYAIAIDTYGEEYTIFTEDTNNPFYSIIAIPNKPIKRGLSWWL